MDGHIFIHCKIPMLPKFLQNVILPEASETTEEINKELKRTHSIVHFAKIQTSNQ